MAPSTHPQVYFLPCFMGRAIKQPFPVMFVHPDLRRAGSVMGQTNSPTTRWSSCTCTILAPFIYSLRFLVNIPPTPNKLVSTLHWAQRPPKMLARIVATRLLEIRQSLRLTPQVFSFDFFLSRSLRIQPLASFDLISFRFSHFYRQLDPSPLPWTT